MSTWLVSLSAAINPALAAPATPVPEPVGFFVWIGAFQQNNVLLELLCLLVALLLALCAVWLLRRASRSMGVPDPSPDQAKGSVWFGRRLIDGVLFPLLWLLFAYAGSVALMRFQPLALFQIALPVLLALVLIRGSRCGCCKSRLRRRAGWFRSNARCRGACG